MRHCYLFLTAAFALLAMMGYSFIDVVTEQNRISDMARVSHLIHRSLIFPGLLFVAFLLLTIYISSFWNEWLQTHKALSAISLSACLLLVLALIFAYMAIIEASMV